MKYKKLIAIVSLTLLLFCTIILSCLPPGYTAVNGAIVPNPVYGTGNVTATGTSSGHIPYFAASNDLQNSSAYYDNLTGYIGLFTNTPTEHFKVNGSANVTADLIISGQIKTDKWLHNDSNTFMGVNVVGADNLAHTGLREGWENTVVGFESGYDITTGYSNTVVGHEAGDSITTGYENTLIGADAGQSITTGNSNVAVGDQAMMNVDVGDSANTVVGKGAMSIADGGYNTAIGVQTLHDSSGDGNTAIGTWAGQSNIGDDNVFVGYRAGENNVGNDKLYIDNSNTATPLIYGDFSTNKVTIYNNLDVIGTLTMSGGITPAHMANADAANDTIYYSTDAGKLVYKDAGGTVHDLY